MYKVNQNTVPNGFVSRFQKPSHFYPIRLSKLNYIRPIHNIKTSKYLISVRGPFIWNSFLSPEEKQITTMDKFKAAIKSRMLFPQNELTFF